MSMNKLGMCLLLLATAGCAGRASTGSESTSALARRDRNVITQAELSDPAVSSMTVLEAIRRLRPNFLSTRGVNSQSDAAAGRVHAAIDNNSVVPLEELRNISASHVVEIRYLDAGAAMQRFGGAAREGPVIVVRTM